MAKQWFCTKFYGGMTDADYINKALERATNFVNSHNLKADEFKVALFDQSKSGNLAFVVVWYYAETVLE